MSKAQVFKETLPHPVAGCSRIVRHPAILLLQVDWSVYRMPDSTPGPERRGQRHLVHHLGDHDDRRCSSLRIDGGSTGNTSERSGYG